MGRLSLAYQAVAITPRIARPKQNIANKQANEAEETTEAISLVEYIILSTSVAQLAWQYSSFYVVKAATITAEP